MEQIYIIAGIIIILGSIFGLKMALKSLKTQVSSQLMINLKNNPQFLKSIVSGNAKNKQNIIDEIQKFIKITNFEEIDENTVDITVLYQDESEHKYRAEKSPDKNKPQILSLTRYS